MPQTLVKYETPNPDLSASRRKYLEVTPDQRRAAVLVVGF
jgi:hypothetical protein